MKVYEKRKAGEQAPSFRRHKKGTGSPSSRGAFLPMSLLILTVVFMAATGLGLLTFVHFYFIKVQQSDPMIVGKYLSIFLLAGTLGVVGGGPLAGPLWLQTNDPHELRRFLPPYFSILYDFRDSLPGPLSMSGMFIIMSNAVTMAIGQSLMPNNLGMASGLLLGFAMGVGGISTTILGWVADHWGIPAALCRPE